MLTATLADITTLPVDAIVSAAGIALDVMRRNEPRFERVIACVFDRESLAIYERLLSEQAGPGGAQ